MTVISAVIAWRTGKAETYFVPRADPGGLRDRVRGLGGDPSAGHRFLVAALVRAEPGWSKLAPVRRAMIELTLAWAALFAFRAAVYGVLIATGRVGWLAAASVAMGWPAFGLWMFLS